GVSERLATDWPVRTAGAEATLIESDFTVEPSGPTNSAARNGKRSMTVMVIVSAKPPFGNPICSSGLAAWGGGAASPPAQALSAREQRRVTSRRSIFEKSIGSARRPDGRAKRLIVAQNDSVCSQRQSNTTRWAARNAAPRRVHAGLNRLQARPTG